MQLEQGMENEKQMIVQQWQAQLVELQNNFVSLKLQHESNLKFWDTQIQVLQHRIEQLKINLELVKFKKEEEELNTLRVQQQITFYQKLAIFHDLCQTTNSLVNQLSHRRTYFDEIEEKISDYINW